jgi:hypothetical protein
MNKFRKLGFIEYDRNVRVHSSLLRVIGPTDDLTLTCGRTKNGAHVVNRNVLYLIIGTLALAAVVTGYLLYQERQKTTGIDITVGKDGISVETK